MPGRTASSIIEYARQTVRTLNAATVAENPSSAKPQSDIQWDITNTKVATIAHWIPASKQILADAPQLQSEIDGELRYGLEFAEEQQLLLGDGTGTNLLGLMPQATAYTAPTGVTVAAIPTRTLARSCCDSCARISIRPPSARRNSEPDPGPTTCPTSTLRWRISPAAGAVTLSRPISARVAPSCAWATRT